MTQMLTEGGYPAQRITTEGRNDLDLRGVCEVFVSRLWIPDHLDPAQAAEYAADYFRRTVLAELKMLMITPVDPCG